jgi:YfiH family protein
MSRHSSPRQARSVWRDRMGATEVRFAGRGNPVETADFLSQEAAVPVELAWAAQVHSNRILDGRPGACGEGDALFTTRAELALCVVTADCVPVLLSDGRRIAAVHAGWRGLVNGVLPAALDRFPDARRVTAWIGPAIGVCCYEVGEDVAARLAASAPDHVVTARPGERPHADLRETAVAQLRRQGLVEIRHIDLCTRCEPQQLWSYRREGPRAGRNLALIWRRNGNVPSD